LPPCPDLTLLLSTLRALDWIPLPTRNDAEAETIFYSSSKGITKSPPNSQIGREINKPPTKSDVDAASDGTYGRCRRRGRLQSRTALEVRNPHRVHAVGCFRAVKRAEKRVTGRSDGEGSRSRATPRLDWTGRIYRHRKTSPKLLRATSSLVCFTGQRDPGSPLSPAPPGRPTDPRLARLRGRIPCFASLLLLHETEHLLLLELSSQKIRYDKTLHLMCIHAFKATEYEFFA